METDHSPSGLNVSTDQASGFVHPAPSVWSDPMPAEFDERIAFFKREGFMILRGLLGQVEVAEIDCELSRLVDDAVAGKTTALGIDLEPNHQGPLEARAFRKIGSIVKQSGALARLTRHEDVLVVLHALVGPRVELVRDVIMMKPAHIGREKPWHQDSAYWPWRPMNLIQVFTALDQMTPDNGGLQIIPRTHLTTLQHYGGELHIDLDEDLQSRAVYVPLQAGDVLLFHSLLLHASEPNRSDFGRRVCICAYKGSDVKFIGEGAEPAPVFVSDRTN